MLLSLREYFEYHGLASRQPRTILPFHDTIIAAMRKLICGTLGRQNLMVLMPPRHGKTLLAHDLISYGLGAVPDSKFIYTGFSATRAASETKEILRDINSPWYKSIFPHISLDQEQGEFFTTKDGGQVYGVGMGGTITGFGAGCKRPEFGGCIVVDDILKADEARSEAALRHCREWYTGTLLSRTNYATTPILLIMQRLNPDDLAGYLLTTEPHKWHVIRIPGQNDDGSTIWPQTRSREDLDLLKKVDEFTYWSQYQQVPIMPGGNMMKRDWWRYFPEAGYDVNGLVFITADTAMKAKESSDYSALALWNATPDHLDLLDIIRGRWEFPELIRQMKGFYDRNSKFGITTIYVEDKASGTPMGQLLSSQGLPCSLWNPADYDFPLDKLNRIKYCLFYLEAGKVRLRQGADWVDPFIDECAAFTGSDSDTDDQCDALSMACSIYVHKGGGSDVRVIGGK